MEQLFGRSFGDVEAHAGRAAELAPLGAQALTVGKKVVFADAQPSPSLVAHEATHVVQNEQAGTAAPMAAGIVAPRDSEAEAEADGIAARVAAHGLGARLPPIIAGPAAHVHLFPAEPAGKAPPATLAPAAHVPSEAREDARVASTTAKPQLAQHGHAMQYYRLHQPAFLETVRTRLLAANLGTGSPHLTWAHGAARFIEQFGFALTGPESKELPELLHPSDPWALIDAHRTMDEDPSLATGAMAWAPAAGLAVAGAVEQSVRASLPRVAARYVAEQGVRSASILVAAHPMDRVVAEALVADGVVTLVSGKTAKPAGPAGYDVQTGGIRLVMSYHWLGERDPSLWNWIQVEEPGDATLEEIAFALWGKTDYAYGLTRIGGYVAIPKEWARQVPGVQVRDDASGSTLDRFDRSPAEQLATSELADGVAVVQGAHAATGDAVRRPPPSPAAGQPASIAPDRAQLEDTLDSTVVILEELRTQLIPWRLDYVLEAGRAFVARQRAALPGAEPATIGLWAPVVNGQRAIVGDAAAGLLQTVQLLAEAGVSPSQLPATDRSHPGLQVLYGYAQAAGTAQLVETAREALARARAAHAMLPVNLIARTSADAGRELSQLGRSGDGDRATATRARSLAADHTHLAGEVATLQSQMMATGAPDPVLLETAGLDAETLSFRARVANLRAGLFALADALDAADEGVLAVIANLSGGARMLLTAHHLEAASTGLGEVEIGLDASQPAAVNARYDALPQGADRERARQFELRDTRKAQLALAKQGFAVIVAQHGLNGALFKEAEQAIHDAQIRKLVANIAVLLAVGVVSGGIAAVAGDFAAGLVGGGRVVAAIGEATGALRTARIAGGVTNVAVDAGLNAGAQTALNGDKLGSSFAENLLTNAAVRAALHPLHTAIRTWGGLDGEAYSLWVQQGAQGKLALAKTAVVTAELITAAATGYAVHRLATLARGHEPDDETVATWAVQGATLVLAGLINSRLTNAIDRLRGAGALAGELIGRMHAQRRVAEAVSDADRIDSGVAMQLLANHQQTLRDEIAFWRRVAADPEAARTLGLDRVQVAAKLEDVEAQRAETQGQAFVYLPLRFAGLMQEVEGSRLWVGDPEQVAEAIANAHAAKLSINVVSPSNVAQGVRVWRVTLNGDSLEIRERARPTRPRASSTAKPEVGARPPQRTGGRYGIFDDPTEEIINDPEPTAEVRKLCDDARAAHPHDIEEQRDYIWRYLNTGELRKNLLARGAKDVKVVSKALHDFGITEATPTAIADVFAYVFDSSGIAFSYENYASWGRLAAGRGRVTDARFLVHELAEVRIMKNQGVDYMGRSMKVQSPAHRRWFDDTFDSAYMHAHKQALRIENQFLADQLARVTGDGHRLTPEEVAAVAGTLDEHGIQSCEYMDTSDGVAVIRHPTFPNWQRRAKEPITLSADSARQLGISERTTLGDLLRALRETRLSVASEARGSESP